MMKWYKVWLIVLGIEEQWWNDMEYTPDKETAIKQANKKAKRQWEEPNYYEFGVEAPSDKKLGQVCPICSGTVTVTNEEYAEWKKKKEDIRELPFV